MNASSANSCVYLSLQFCFPLHPCLSPSPLLSVSCASDDRVWSFGCRKIEHATLESCQWTDNLHEAGGLLNYTVPAGHALRGLESSFDNGLADRVWKAYICEVALSLF